MDRKIIITALAAMLLSSAAYAGGRKDYVNVPFSAVKGEETLHKGGLDGSVKFYWSDEGGPKGGGELSARGYSRRGATDEERCAKAVAAALVTFQKRAHKEGAKAVTDIRTFSDADKFSGSRNKCLCVSGGSGSRTIVKGRLVK